MENFNFIIQFPETINIFAFETNFEKLSYRRPDVWAELFQPSEIDPRAISNPKSAS